MVKPSAEDAALIKRSAGRLYVLYWDTLHGIGELEPKCAKQLEEAVDCAIAGLFGPNEKWEGDYDGEADDPMRWARAQAALHERTFKEKVEAVLGRAFQDGGREGLQVLDKAIAREVGKVGRDESDEDMETDSDEDD